MGHLLKSNTMVCNLFTRNIMMTAPCLSVGKKKKKTDPEVLKAKVDKKIKRIERAIREIEMVPKKLIPIIEYQLSPNVMRTINERERKDEQDSDIIKRDYNNMVKVWAIYGRMVTAAENKSIISMVNAKNKALRSLKNSNTELYDAAISIDDSFLPFQDHNMRKETSTIHGYKPPDGKITDITKKWIM